MNTRLSVRQHWMALIKPGAILMVALALVFVWMHAHLAEIIRSMHITRTTPGVEVVVFFYHNLWIFVLAPILVAGFMVFMAWSWWSISYFEVDDWGLKYKIGPFIENTIPLRAIQDIRMTRPLLGVFLGYGTLVVDSGREEEKLIYVPEIETFYQSLRPSM